MFSRENDQILAVLDFLSQSPVNIAVFSELTSVCNTLSCFKSYLKCEE